MFKWKDGIKVSDAYVDENGTIHSAVYEGDTPLKAHNLNLAQRQLINDICKKAKITTSESIAENTNYEIPLNYKVGNNSLEIYYMGEKLVKDEHYIEVGEADAISNIIQFKDWGQAVPTNRVIEFIVRGDYNEQT